MDNQDINAEFKSFIKKYARNNPSKRLAEIAARRGIELNQLNEESLSNAEADSKAMRVWKQAQTDLKQLVDPMPSTLWNLAYKYFADDLFGCDSDEEKKEAISDVCELPENRIDAEAELAEKVKEKICGQQCDIAGKSYTLFGSDEAESKTPAELCDALESRMTEMGAIIDQDTRDYAVYNDVQNNHTFEDYFVALAAFLDMKIGETLKSGNMPLYKFSYDDSTNCMVGKHVRTGMEVVTVTPDINDEDDTGTTDDLICDISVAGLGLPDTNPTVNDTKEMREVISYITRHRRYSPGDDGQYTISGVNGSDVPELVCDAVQDWQATSTACNTVAKAWTEAHDLLGDDNMSQLKQNVRMAELYRDMGRSKTHSATMSRLYKDKYDDMEARTNLVKPKVDKTGNFRDDDLSHVFKKLQIALGGKTSDGEIFTDDELADIADLDDDSADFDSRV